VFFDTIDSLRTTEYRDRNAQYMWVLQALDMRAPQIKEFARLGMVHTVMSKRKLQWFVDQGHVSGWSDPRFPTVQGLLRRGLTVEAIKEFILGQGFADGVDSTQEWDKVWTHNKRVIDPLAPRYTAVLQQDRVPMVLEEELVDKRLEVDLHPKYPALGKKVVTVSSRMQIEQEDACLIGDGEEITMLHRGNVIVTSIDRDAKTGVVLSIRARANPQGSAKTTSKKISWLDASDLVPVVLIELDALLTVPRVEDGVAFESVVNPQTRRDTLALGEKALLQVKPGQIIQVVRRGFFIVDAIAPVLQLIFIPDGKQQQ
jgi:glutamyl-tRNA synthetase